MRQKREAVLCFESNDEGLPKVVRDYRGRYRAISQVLDKNPEILDLVDRDLRKLSQGGRQGRKADFTSENILRALIVQHVEGLPFREMVIRMGGDGCLQDFLRTRKKAVMDYSFLDKCSLAIRPETWKRVNELLGSYGVRQGVINPKVNGGEVHHRLRGLRTARGGLQPDRARDPAAREAVWPAARGPGGGQGLLSGEKEV
jgi:hypothetical protein